MAKSSKADPKNGVQREDVPYLDFEKPLADLDKQISDLRKLQCNKGIDYSSEIHQLESNLVNLTIKTYNHLSAWETVQSNAEELVFVSSYSVLAGVNGPPIVPLGLKEVDGRMTRSDVLSGV